MWISCDSSKRCVEQKQIKLVLIFQNYVVYSDHPTTGAHTCVHYLWVGRAWAWGILPAEEDPRQEEDHQTKGRSCKLHATYHYVSISRYINLLNSFGEQCHLLTLTFR